jgi:mannose-6-phosphate isomerase-like protein (cupin superfamily)
MFHDDIVKLAKENENFRKVIYTGPHSQLVVMSLPLDGEIGEETHTDIDQVLYLVDGQGQSIIEDHPTDFIENEVVFVPAGTKHNFINTGDQALKLYTVYSPPAHADGTIHKTKAEADQDEKDNYQKP